MFRTLHFIFLCGLSALSFAEAKPARPVSPFFHDGNAVRFGAKATLDFPEKENGDPQLKSLRPGQTFSAHLAALSENATFIQSVADQLYQIHTSADLRIFLNQGNLKSYLEKRGVDTKLRDDCLRQMVLGLLMQDYLVELSSLAQIHLGQPKDEDEAKAIGEKIRAIPSELLLFGAFAARASFANPEIAKFASINLALQLLGSRILEGYKAEGTKLSDRDFAAFLGVIGKNSLADGAGEREALRQRILQRLSEKAGSFDDDLRAMVQFIDYGAGTPLWTTDQAVCQDESTRRVRFSLFESAQKTPIQELFKLPSKVALTEQANLLTAMPAAQKENWNQWVRDQYARQHGVGSDRRALALKNTPAIPSAPAQSRLLQARNLAPTAARNFERMFAPKLGEEQKLSLLALSPKALAQLKILSDTQKQVDPKSFDSLLHGVSEPTIAAAFEEWEPLVLSQEITDEAKTANRKRLQTALAQLSSPHWTRQALVDKFDPYLKSRVGQSLTEVFRSLKLSPDDLKTAASKDDLARVRAQLTRDLAEDTSAALPQFSQSVFLEAPYEFVVERLKDQEARLKSDKIPKERHAVPTEDVPKLTARLGELEALSNAYRLESLSPSHRTSKDGPLYVARAMELAVAYEKEMVAIERALYGPRVRYTFDEAEIPVVDAVLVSKETSSLPLRSNGQPPDVDRLAKLRAMSYFERLEYCVALATEIHRGSYRPLAGSNLPLSFSRPNKTSDQLLEYRELCVATALLEEGNKILSTTGMTGLNKAMLSGDVARLRKWSENDYLNALAYLKGKADPRYALFRQAYLKAYPGKENTASSPKWATFDVKELATLPVADLSEEQVNGWVKDLPFHELVRLDRKLALATLESPPFTAIARNAVMLRHLLAQTVGDAQAEALKRMQEYVSPLEVMYQEGRANGREVPIPAQVLALRAQEQKVGTTDLRNFAAIFNSQRLSQGLKLSKEVEKAVGLHLRVPPPVYELSESNDQALFTANQEATYLAEQIKTKGYYWTIKGSEPAGRRLTELRTQIIPALERDRARLDVVLESSGDTVAAWKDWKSGSLSPGTGHAKAWVDQRLAGRPKVDDPLKGTFASVKEFRETLRKDIGEYQKSVLAVGARNRSSLLTKPLIIDSTRIRAELDGTAAEQQAALREVRIIRDELIQEFRAVDLGGKTVPNVDGQQIPDPELRKEVYLQSLAHLIRSMDRTLLPGLDGVGYKLARRHIQSLTAPTDADSLREYTARLHSEGEAAKDLDRATEVSAWNEWLEKHFTIALPLSSRLALLNLPGPLRDQIKAGIRRVESSEQRAALAKALLNGAASDIEALTAVTGPPVSNSEMVNGRLVPFEYRTNYVNGRTRGQTKVYFQWEEGPDGKWRKSYGLPKATPPAATASSIGTSSPVSNPTAPPVSSSPMSMTPAPASTPSLTPNEAPAKAIAPTSSSQSAAVPLRPADPSGSGFVIPKISDLLAMTPAVSKPRAIASSLTHSNEELAQLENRLATLGQGNANPATATAIVNEFYKKETKPSSQESDSLDSVIYQNSVYDPKSLQENLKSYREIRSQLEQDTQTQASRPLGGDEVERPPVVDRLANLDGFLESVAFYLKARGKALPFSAQLKFAQMAAENLKAKPPKADPFWKFRLLLEYFCADCSSGKSESLTRKNPAQLGILDDSLMQPSPDSAGQILERFAPEIFTELNRSGQIPTRESLAMAIAQSVLGQDPPEMAKHAPEDALFTRLPFVKKETYQDFLTYALLEQSNLASGKGYQRLKDPKNLEQDLIDVADEIVLKSHADAKAAIAKELADKKITEEESREQLKQYQEYFDAARARLHGSGGNHRTKDEKRAAAVAEAARKRFKGGEEIAVKDENKPNRRIDHYLEHLLKEAPGVTNLKECEENILLENDRDRTRLGVGKIPALQALKWQKRGLVEKLRKYEEELRYLKAPTYGRIGVLLASQQMYENQGPPGAEMAAIFRAEGEKMSARALEVEQMVGVTRREVEELGLRIVNEGKPYVDAIAQSAKDGDKKYKACEEKFLKDVEKVIADYAPLRPNWASGGAQDFEKDFGRKFFRFREEVREHVRHRLKWDETAEACISRLKDETAREYIDTTRPLLEDGWKGFGGVGIMPSMVSGPNSAEIDAGVPERGIYVDLVKEECARNGKNFEVIRPVADRLRTQHRIYYDGHRFDFSEAEFTKYLDPKNAVGLKPIDQQLSEDFERLRPFTDDKTNAYRSLLHNLSDRYMESGAVGYMFVNPHTAIRVFTEEKDGKKTFRSRLVSQDSTDVHKELVKKATEDCMKDTIMHIVDGKNEKGERVYLPPALRAQALHQCAGKLAENAQAWMKEAANKINGLNLFFQTLPTYDDMMYGNGPALQALRRQNVALSRLGKILDALAMLGDMPYDVPNEGQRVAKEQAAQIRMDIAYKLHTTILEKETEMNADLKAQLTQLSINAALAATSGFGAYVGRAKDLAHVQGAAYLPWLARTKAIQGGVMFMDGYRQGWKFGGYNALGGMIAQKTFQSSQRDYWVGLAKNSHNGEFKWSQINHTPPPPGMDEDGNGIVTIAEAEKFAPAQIRATLQLQSTHQMARTFGMAGPTTAFVKRLQIPYLSSPMGATIGSMVGINLGTEMLFGPNADSYFDTVIQGLDAGMYAAPIDDFAARLIYSMAAPLQRRTGIKLSTGPRSALAFLAALGANFVVDCGMGYLDHYRSTAIKGKNLGRFTSQNLGAASSEWEACVFNMADGWLTSINASGRSLYGAPKELMEAAIQSGATEAEIRDLARDVAVIQQNGGWYKLFVDGWKNDAIQNVDLPKVEEGVIKGMQAREVMPALRDPNHPFHNRMVQMIGPQNLANLDAKYADWTAQGAPASDYRYWSRKTNAAAPFSQFLEFINAPSRP